jgi:hypothetical protein
MRQGIQIFLQEAGEAACYALTIIKLAEDLIGKHIDIVDALEKGTDAKYIYYNAKNMNDNNNFYVEKPDLFLTMLTNKKCTVSHVPVEYKAQKNEYLIDRWERVTTRGTMSHFRLPEWDCYPGSPTVTQGKIVSRRCFKII